MYKAFLPLLVFLAPSCLVTNQKVKNLPLLVLPTPAHPKANTYPQVSSHTSLLDTLVLPKSCYFGGTDDTAWGLNPKVLRYKGFSLCMCSKSGSFSLT